MNSLDNIELIEKYLNNELDQKNRLEVETRLEQDPVFLDLFENHVSFLQDLHNFNHRAEFKNHLQQAANNADNHLRHGDRSKTQKSLVRRLISQKEVGIKNLSWKFNLISAAAVAIIAVFSTLWLTGYYKNLEKNTTYYKELRRDVNAVRQNVNAHHAAIKDMHNSNASSNNFGATGFMLSVNGYVVTNNHVITGADSIHLQNSKGESFQAKIIYTDETRDLAILMINDPEFQKPKTLPYAFKEAGSELGEDVFTLGYPRDEPVYGQGYLSSMSGYDGDTTAYQISIPLNPGNSGGPLLDSRGHVIGIISGKQSGLDGTSFAIKSKSILDLIDQIPAEDGEEKISIQKKNHLSGLKRTEQLHKIKDFVYLVKVF